MFLFIKNAFKKIYNTFVQSFTSFFNKEKIDKKDLETFKIDLLKNDFGYQTTEKIIQNIQQEYKNNEELTGKDARNVFLKILTEMISLPLPDLSSKKVYMLSGVNGAGKTTTCIKLANYLKNRGFKTVIIAADTFRAAAVEQLISGASKHNIDCFYDHNEKDPSTLVFKGLEHAKKTGYEKIIIDTSGRLQTKEPLMRELAKIHRIILRHYTQEEFGHLLVIDALLGQNSFDQATIFNEVIRLQGIILTKTDASHKPGILFSIVDSLKTPITYVTFGERIEDINEFNHNEFINNLFQL